MAKASYFFFTPFSFFSYFFPVFGWKTIEIWFLAILLISGAVGQNIFRWIWKVYFNCLFEENKVCSTIYIYLPTAVLELSVHNQCLVFLTATHIFFNTTILLLLLLFFSFFFVLFIYIVLNRLVVVLNTRERKKILKNR